VHIRPRSQLLDDVEGADAIAAIGCERQPMREDQDLHRTSRKAA
jgi:hypothetical protein